MIPQAPPKDSKRRLNSISNQIHALTRRFQPHLKNMLVKMGSSSPSFGVNKKIFELQPPRNLEDPY